MNRPIEISVVMGVHNGEADLSAALDNIFGQQDVALECIVVDDGSTDATPSILAARAAAEPRLRVQRQDKAGLTRALIAGCALARGEFIARQDVGDRSHPKRLSEQRDVLSADSHFAFVACRFVTVGPNGETLGGPEPTDGGKAIIASLTTVTTGGMQGPHHGSVMFRRSAYEQVGGYRPEFYFAQDLDLWSRLIEVGGLAFVDEVLYQSSFERGSISARHRAQQLVVRDLIRETTLQRRTGISERDALDRAAQIRPGTASDFQRIDAGAEYFIGSCLYARRDPAAAEYMRRAIASDPFHFRAWVKLLCTRLRSRSALDQSNTA